MPARSSGSNATTEPFFVVFVSFTQAKPDFPDSGINHYRTVCICLRYHIKYLLGFQPPSPTRHISIQDNPSN